MMTILTIAIQQ